MSKFATLRYLGENIIVIMHWPPCTKLMNIFEFYAENLMVLKTFRGDFHEQVDK